jgi:hypothetical protein
MNSLAFDLSTPYGRMMATMTSGITEFERELAGIVKPNRAASDPPRLVLSTVRAIPPVLSRDPQDQR